MERISYNFGEFTLDVSERRLLRADSLVPLTPKAFELLVVFVTNPGRMLDKDFLFEHVWRDTFVSDVTLAKNVSNLRKALDDDGTIYIETIPKTGYRFVADVMEEMLPPIARLHTSLDPASPTELTAVVPPKRTVTARPVLIALIAIVGLAAAIALLSVGGRKALADRRFRKVDLSMLSSDGLTNRVAISPDGKYVALVKAQGAQRAIELRSLADEKTVEIFAPQPKLFRGITFSPDSNSIYFVTYEQPYVGGPAVYGTLYRIPLFGGVPEPIARDVDSGIAISAKGNTYAFVRQTQTDRKSQLMLAEFGAEPHVLATRELKEGYSLSGLSFSPDGSTIATTVSGPTADPTLVGVSTKDGTEAPLTEPGAWHFVEQPTWLADGSGIVFAGKRRDTAGPGDDIWMLSLPDKELRRLREGVGGPYSLGVSSDASVMVTIATTRMANFWIADGAKLNSPRRFLQFATEANFAYPGITWTRDGHIRYSVTINGAQSIWDMAADGSDRRSITSGVDPQYSPFATPDGRYMLYLTSSKEGGTLWRSNIDGSERIALLSKQRMTSPSVADGGEYVYFSRYDDGPQPFLYRIPIAGGVPEKVGTQPVIAPRISPSGKYIICFLPDPAEKASTEFRLTIINAADGTVVHQYPDVPLRASNGGMTTWLNDGTFTYATVDGDVSKLWSRNMRSDKATLLTESVADALVALAWCSACKQLVFETITASNDAMALRSVD